MTSEAVLEPELPICDAHHHLWLRASGHGRPYPLATLRQDTGTGHNVLRTVFVECHAEYRTDGPEHLRPVGETEFVAAAAAESARLGGPEIAGIVAHADLCLGDAVEEVLVAHEAAGGGRFRGVRYTTAHDDFPMNNSAARSGIMAEEPFRQGVRRLGEMGYSYDVFCFHPQLPELTELARACPEVTIVANHLGVPIAGGPYRGPQRRDPVVLANGHGRAGDVPERGAQAGRAHPAAFGRALGQAGHPRHLGRGCRPRGAARSATPSTSSARRAACSSRTSPSTSPSSATSSCGTRSSASPPDLTSAEKVDLFHDTAARAYRLPLAG